MNKLEIFQMIRRNKHPKTMAVTFISDFLGINQKEAERIYDTEYRTWAGERNE